MFSFKKHENSSKKYESYIFEYNTLKLLSKYDKKSIITVFRYLKSLLSKEPSPLPLKSVIISADASYFKQKFGVLVFMDALTRKCLWWKFLSGKESISDYKKDLAYCAKHYQIKAIIGDGILGLMVKSGSESTHFFIYFTLFFITK